MGFAGLIGEEEELRGRRELVDDEMEFLTELISVLVLPSRVIFARGEERGRVDNGVGGNGCFWRPGFGEMSSFWFSGEMEREFDIASERS